MKLKWLYGVLAGLFIFLSIVLLLEKEEEFMIITSPKIYSIYHSDDLETFTIEFLTNQPEHFYFDTDFISQLSISNTEQTFPITILDLIVQPSVVLVNDTPYKLITMKCRTEMFSTNLWVHIEDAILTIDYLNGKELSVEIGEFNYLFLEQQYEDVALYELSATYEDVGDINSVGGININLHNRSLETLEILSIDLVATGVLTNEAMMIKRPKCDYDKTVAECLYIDSYSFFVTPVSTTLHEFVLSKHNFEAYIPLSYDLFPYISDFAIQVTYRINGFKRIFVVDDFPFMKTANFQESMEEYYHVYTPNNPNLQP